MSRNSKHAERQQRLKWKIDSNVEIYSVSQSQWFPGRIHRVLKDDRVEIQYATQFERNTKSVQRDSNHLRPATKPAKAPPKTVEKSDQSDPKMQTETETESECEAREEREHEEIMAQFEAIKRRCEESKKVRKERQRRKYEKAAEREAARLKEERLKREEAVKEKERLRQQRLEAERLRQEKAAEAAAAAERERLRKQKENENEKEREALKAQMVRLARIAAEKHKEQEKATAQEHQRERVRRESLSGATKWQKATATSKTEEKQEMWWKDDKDDKDDVAASDIDIDVEDELKVLDTMMETETDSRESTYPQWYVEMRENLSDDGDSEEEMEKCSDTARAVKLKELERRVCDVVKKYGRYSLDMVCDRVNEYGDLSPEQHGMIWQMIGSLKEMRRVDGEGFEEFMVENSWATRIMGFCDEIVERLRSAADNC